MDNRNFAVSANSKELQKLLGLTKEEIMDPKKILRNKPTLDVKNQKKKP